MFRSGDVHKTYWAIVQNRPPKDEDTLTDWLVRNEKQNKSYVRHSEGNGAKKRCWITALSARRTDTP